MTDWAIDANIVMQKAVRRLLGACVEYTNGRIFVPERALALACTHYRSIARRQARRITRWDTPSPPKARLRQAEMNSSSPERLQSSAHSPIGRTPNRSETMACGPWPRQPPNRFASHSVSSSPGSPAKGVEPGSRKTPR